MTYITCINGSWYAFEGWIKHGKVLSIGSDNPSKGRWFAGWSKAGVKCVASASPSREVAYAKAKRHGSYAGEVWL